MRLFNTPLKFMAQIAWHGCDDGLCFTECRLESRFLAAVHLKNRNFKVASPSFG